MSSLLDGGSHREAQALPLPRMVRSQTGDSRGFQKVGATSKNFSVKANGRRATLVEQVGVCETQKLEYTSRRVSGAMWPLTAPCWAPLGKGERGLGSGAVGL